MPHRFNRIDVFAPECLLARRERSTIRRLGERKLLQIELDARERKLRFRELRRGYFTTLESIRLDAMRFLDR
jgi:hypothetical protein